MDNENLVTGYLERIQSDCPNAVPRIDLKGNQVTMGRGIGNTVIWESLQISRRHAVMEYRNQTWKIKDTSTNGMLVNSRRIPQNMFVDLHDSDMISFVPTGALQYRFVKSNHIKHNTINLTSPSVSASLQHSRNNSDSSVSVIVSNPGKSPKRKGAPDPQAQERKRKRIVLTLKPERETNEDDEEELLDIDELPDFFEKPISVSTPIKSSSNNDENGIEILSSPGQDLDTVKRQLRKCQEKLQEMETRGRLKDREATIEMSRLRSELATSRSESRVFQEELYKKIMETLEHEFSCCICNEVFIQATVIDCGHTFCAHCISEWVKRKTECPNCRKPVKIQVKHTEMENFVTKLHTMFSEEIKVKREQILDDRRREVETAAAAAVEAARNASRARGRGPVPMEFDHRFDFIADFNNLREMLVPRGIHPPNFIPHQGPRPYAHAHNNILSFPFPEFMRGAEPPPAAPGNSRRRSQRINHPRDAPIPASRIRVRGAQQVPEAPPRLPHINEYLGGGPMDILTVD